MNKTVKITITMELTDEQITRWMEEESCDRKDVGRKIGEYITIDVLPLSHAYATNLMPDVIACTSTQLRTKRA